MNSNSKTALINQVKDPVCGMMIDPHSKIGGSSVYQKKTYYFCNPKCKIKFDVAPSTYLNQKKRSYCPGY